MKDKEFIPYAKQSITQSDIKSVTKAMQSSFLTRGPEVAHFEEDVAKYCGAKYAVAFTSGTEALTAACFAAKVDSYDRLITSANSFIASATSAMRLGARVVLADIDLKTGCATNSELLKHLDEPLSRGKYILMPVHYGGITSDMKELNQKIKDPDAIIIEDACAALGSLYPSGEKVGSCTYSDMTTFSFHPAKTITTGEGGMVLTNNKELEKRLRLYRNNGITKDPEEMRYESPGPWYFESLFVGVNNNFTDMQAALGRSQMKRLGKNLEKRRKLAAKYRKNLSKIKYLQVMEESWDQASAQNIYFVRIDFSKLKISKPELMQKLHDQGIGTQVHYIPIYRHPCFIDQFGDQVANYPNMEKFYSQALTLPLYYGLNENQIDEICEALKGALSNKP